MKLALLLTLSLCLASVALATAAPIASAAPCRQLHECVPGGTVGPCEHGWSWAGMTDEQGFWYPYVDCTI